MGIPHEWAARSRLVRAASSVALAVCLLQSIPAAQEPNPDDPLAGLTLPALDYRSHTIEEWKKLFRESGGRSALALWSIYAYDQRGPEVTGWLKAELARMRGADFIPAGKYASSSQSVVGWGKERGTKHREVDAILDHWNVAHECLELQQYWDPGMAGGKPLPGAPTVFHPLPGRLLELPTAQLVSLLETGDSQTVSRAAMTLVQREKEIDVAMRALVHQLSDIWKFWPGTIFEAARASKLGEEDYLFLNTLPWAWGRAGSEAERAIAGLLTDPEESFATKRYLLEKIGLKAPTLAGLRDPDALPLALIELMETSSLAESARRELFTIYRVEPYRRRSDLRDMLTSTRASASLDRPRAEAHLARAVAIYVEADAAAWGVETKESVRWAGPGMAAADRQDLERLLVIRDLVLCSPATREVARPWLLQLLDRPAPLRHAALWLLCVAGESGAEVRAAYCQRLVGIDVNERASVDQVPSLTVHDPATLAALTRVVLQTDHRGVLGQQLQAAGLLRQDPVGEAARAYFASVDGSWRALGPEAGPPPCVLEESDDAMTRIMKLSFLARTKQLAGLNPAPELDALWEVLRTADPLQQGYPGNFYEQAIIETARIEPDRGRFADWSIAQLMNIFATYRGQKRAMADALLETELSRRQQAALCQTQVSMHRNYWSELFARQGAASIERVVDLRRQAYRDVARLDYVLRVTRLSELDEQLLLQTLERGPAKEREAALKIIQEFELDSEALRAAVRGQRNDCDDRVRALAIELCATLGW